MVEKLSMFGLSGKTKTTNNIAALQLGRRQFDGCHRLPTFIFRDSFSENIGNEDKKWQTLTIVVCGLLLIT